MKRFMGLILACALALTCVVMPLTASAADLGDATVTFKVYSDAELASELEAGANIYRAQIIYLKATASVPNEDEVYGAQLDFTLNSNFENIEIVEGDVIELGDGVYEFLKEGDAALDLDNLFVLSATVKANAAVGTVADLVTADASADSVNMFTTEAVDSYDVSYAASNINIAVHEVGAKVVLGESETELVDGANSVIIRGAEGAKLELSFIPGITVANYSVYNNGNAINMNEDHTYDLTYGTYLLTVTVVNETTKTFKFVYEADGQSFLEAEPVPSQVKAGEEFTVPVTITTASVNVAMVEYDVAFDADVFELEDGSVAASDGVAGITYDIDAEAGTAKIIYGADGNDVVLNGTGVAVNTLNFTAKEDNTALGLKDITVTPVRIVYAHDYVTTDGNLATTPIECDVNVIPKDGTVYATVSADQTTPTNTPYTETITANYTGGTMVAINYATVLDGETTQEDLATAYATGSENVVTDTVTVSSADDVYVIAKIGNYYELVGVIDSKFDAEAPTIAAEAHTQYVDSKGGYTFNFTVADNVTAAPTTTYALVEKNAEAPADGDYAATTTNATVALAEMTGEYVIYIKAVDEAGNSAVEDFALMLDAEAPVIADIVQGDLDYVDETATKTVTFTVTDANAGLAQADAVVVRFADAESGATVEVTGEGTYSFVADQTGNYYIIATDALGHVATSDAIAVALNKLSIDAEFGVKLAEEGAEIANGFKKDADVATTGATNGTFGYVELVAKERAGYTNEYFVKIGEGEYTKLDFDGDEVLAPGVYSLKTVQTYAGDDVTENFYTFEVVDAREEIATVDNNGKFNIIDYALLRRVGAGTEALRANFTGGYFAGDVNANLQADEATDAALLLLQMKEGKRASTFDFALYAPFAE